MSDLNIRIFDHKIGGLRGLTAGLCMHLVLSLDKKFSSRKSLSLSPRFINGYQVAKRKTNKENTAG